ncbi:Trans-aconitate methyltransferase [Paenibacillus uliginis N3/975]|uniref:Trans-aconitate methyltransferase n=1 Tax=Paenibacillus uliginis N3/975 TaxID=1313296 RepID=A0A1X7HM86_9BACL|nr:class I SAM-dependent methyltransferase [Paenibacillus uliginis]SMF89306.1 Trans-aconitate methyltransferase [Paenibacillus uliginis N3/975]
MSSDQVWKPEDYDRQLSFVSTYGRGLIELLAPQQGERILDLGCGTGDLANEIAASGSSVVGMDFSEEMIRRAKVKYPHLTFVVGNGEDFNTDTLYDAVFSNAALHWMTKAADAASSVYRALNPGGRFVAEFGGAGNIGMIAEAIQEVLSSQYGIDTNSRNPWYYPSIGEYASLLEKTGFRVALAHHFDRPTRLLGGENGIKDWLTHFGDNFFIGFTPDDKKNAIEHISQLTKHSLWKDDAFYADYKRLRIVAFK